MPHKSADLKLLAVQHYLLTSHDSFDVPERKQRQMNKKQKKKQRKY